ncbi:MAG: thermonuclease family protein [Deltaproteobacteria bacterium]|nr:thermonuclease family protein [Deltaproteobacteria bacterium]
MVIPARPAEYFPPKTILYLILFFISLPGISFAEVRDAYVKYVVDGDTVRLYGGESVRYIGIDTPEKGEPFYGEAKGRNKALVKGKRIRLVICDEEKRDKYGRLLAWVYADGVFVNKVLIKEGMGKTLMIPPCGLKTEKEFKEAERGAKEGRLGIWAGVK